MDKGLVDALARQRLFRDMQPELLQELAAGADFVDLRGGTVLFEAGSPASAMFLVVTGRLQVDLGGGRFANVGDGESVGEIGVVLDEPRGGRVVALRDSHLIRLPRDRLLDCLMRHPQAMLALGRVVMRRLRSNADRAEDRQRARISNVAVLETRAGRGGREFLRRFADALAVYGETRVIDEAAVETALGEGAAGMPYAHNAANRNLVRWLYRQESETNFLIYTAAREEPAWWRRCLRQADHVLLLVDCGDLPEWLPILQELRRLRLSVPVSIVLRRGANPGEVQAMAWRELVGARSHYFWRGGSDADISAIARQLIGVANGLVLGGGGARGFAHLGVIRALDELGIRVDVLGGSSMGAFIAALRATGLSALEMVKETRAAFVDRNYLNDFTLPRVALIRGKRFLRHMERVFGQTLIEDLPTPYFCVTTNLTQGRADMHQSGQLFVWVATSMAVPGVAPPVAWKGDLHADGAVANSLPADLMQEMGRGPVIASSVSTEGAIAAPGIEGPDPGALFNWQSEAERPSLFDILFRTATLTSESGNLARASAADIYLRMPVSDIGMFQWDAIDQLVRIGYEQAMRELSGRRDELLTGG